MDFEGYATCPGCGFEEKIGRFEGAMFLGVSDDSKVVELAQTTEMVKDCHDFKVFRLICSNCGLIFLSSTMTSLKLRKIDAES